MGVYRLLQDDICFPDVTLAEEDGLLAVGGDLSLERLVFAYSCGIFPWYNPGEEILWWCPKRRFVIFPGKVHISRSMKKWMRREVESGHYRVYLNRDFRETMHQCRMVREENEGTWISDEMEEAYQRLNKSGFAYSVEVYSKEDMEERLVGGLYGVSVGTCFFGESMFSKEENTSKLALIALSQILEKAGFLFIDCQFHTEHLESMGGVYLEWKEFEKLLREGTKGLWEETRE